jgi:glycosyltransferase involved in cell wall biosynthesis
MRVLLFRYLCDTGGISTWMQEHARELRRQGVEPHFWFCTASVRLDEFRELGPTTLAPMSDLVRAIEAGAYDVIHISSSDPRAELLSLMQPRPKIVASNRGALSDYWQSRNCFARTAVSRGMARLDQPMTDLVVEPVPNGFDGSRFTPPDATIVGTPIVAWVGRTTDLAGKDFPRFTRIASRLAGRPIRLWVGDGHGADWSQFAVPPCARVDIERWERVPHVAMPDWYRAVAASGGLVVMTSPSEGFGWVAVEAAASGARTLAPRVVGLTETVIDGVTGSLFPPDASDDEVAGRVLAMLEQRDGVAEMRRRSEVARDTFSLERMTRAYLEIYSRTDIRLAANAPAVLPVPPDPATAVLFQRLQAMRKWRVRTRLDEVSRLLEADYTTLARRLWWETVTRFPREMLLPDTRRLGSWLGLRLGSRWLKGKR